MPILGRTAAQHSGNCASLLRKQWSLNVRKIQPAKYCIGCQDFKDQRKNGSANPFKDQKVVICSMHYAASCAEEIKAVDWDLVVIDEAHKLRNAYRESNLIGQRIDWATENHKKLLYRYTSAKFAD